MSSFEYTDADGDCAAAWPAIEGHPQGYAVVLETGDPGEDNYECVGLTADAARDLAAKLTEWAGEETPERMPAAFAVGDRVQVIYGHGWNGPGVVETVSPRPDRNVYIVRVQTEEYGEAVGGFEVADIRVAPTPDYAAKAATFKPGDLAIVGEKPSLNAEADGYGVRVEDFAGKAVNVVSAGYASPGAASVLVALGNGDANYIHVAHLTRVQAVKW